VSDARFETVARMSALAPGDILPAKVGGQDIILYRVGGAVRAAQRYCLHQHADLADGIVSRGFLICSAHGWRYDATTGVHELSPETCLSTFTVRVVGDEIQVDPTPIRQGVTRE
jgi:nitrite reductase/ring-hydroxylating ferredoxin subunit